MGRCSSGRSRRSTAPGRMTCRWWSPRRIAASCRIPRAGAVLVPEELAAEAAGRHDHRSWSTIPPRRIDAGGDPAASRRRCRCRASTRRPGSGAGVELGSGVSHRAARRARCAACSSARGCRLDAGVVLEDDVVARRRLPLGAHVVCGPRCAARRAGLDQGGRGAGRHRLRLPQQRRGAPADPPRRRLRHRRRRGDRLASAASTAAASTTPSSSGAPRSTTWCISGTTCASASTASWRAARWWAGAPGSGDFVVVGGGAGIGDHVSIGDGARVGAGIGRVPRRAGRRRPSSGYVGAEPPRDAAGAGGARMRLPPIMAELERIVAERRGDA